MQVRMPYSKKAPDIENDRSRSMYVFVLTNAVK